MFSNGIKFKKTCFLKLILAFFTYSSFSQSPIYKHFTAKDGLPHDITYGLIQDSNGFLWIGTDDGLTRFDGKSFKNYGYEDGLTSNYVIDIIETKKNEYAIATWGGGLHYFKNDTIFKPKIEDDKHTKINILGILNNGTIYANSNKSQFKIYEKIHEKEFVVKNYSLENPLLPLKELTLSDRNIYSFQTALNGDLYFHAPEKINSKETNELKGIFKAKENNLIPVFKFLEDKLIFTIAKDQNQFYFGSINSIFVGENKSLKETILFDFKDETKIIHIKKQKDNLFFITNNATNLNRKLYKFNLTSKKLTSLSDYLKTDKMISDFIFDTQSNLWVTTYGNGIYVIPNTSNSFFSSETFSNNDIKDVQVINNQLYLLAPNVFYHFNNNKVDTEKKLSLLTESFLYLSKENTINFLVFKGHKLNEKSANFNFNFNYISKLNFIYELDRQFFKIDPYEISLKDSLLSVYKKGKLYSQIPYDFIIKKMVVKNNKLYILPFKNKGLTVYDLTSGEILEKFDENNSIQTNRITNFLLSEADKLFLATDRGLFTIKNDSILQYTSKNGLESNHINDIVLDKHNVLWIGTQKGLNVMLNDAFYTVDAILGQKSSFITKVLTKGNYLYATGNQGLFKFNNSSAFTPNSSPNLKIKQNKSLFTLHPISLLHGESLSVSYKIDDNDWVEAPYSTLNFEYLKQGKHQVIFRYKDNNSNWSITQPYFFSVLYPWYTQSWFYALITLLISIIIILISYKLLKKSKKKNEELKNTINEKEKLKQTLTTVRKNLAQDFHDELGNKLASITMLTNLLMIKNPKKNDTYNKLEKIKDDSNYLYSGMKDFIWSLNNESDKLDEVLLYITEFGKNLFNNTNINFYVETEMNKTHITLPYYWSKQIIFIFKEAMTNALKHSNASEVSFTFNLINNELTLILSDNGVGFKEHLLDRQNGILNMKNRAEKITSSLTIISNKQKTIVTFTGKLKNC